MKNKIIDVICFVGGGALFVGTLFSFEPSSTNFRGSSGISYNVIQIILLALSAGLIILGFLIRSWRKEK